MKVAYKVWLENDGKVFGEGPYQLLKEIEKTGSLHQAAMVLGMSYRKAWLVLHGIEERLGFALVERKVGGIAGGGSTITEAGQSFLKHYEAFRFEVKGALESIYARHFEPSEGSPKQ